MISGISIIFDWICGICWYTNLWSIGISESPWFVTCQLGGGEGIPARCTRPLCVRVCWQLQARGSGCKTWDSCDTSLPHLPTGHSTNFVCYFHLPSDVEVPDFFFQSERLKIEFSDIPICLLLEGCDDMWCYVRIYYILYIIKYVCICMHTMCQLFCHVPWVDCVVNVVLDMVFTYICYTFSLLQIRKLQ